MSEQDFIAHQGSSIAAALVREGYQAEAMKNYPGWKITKEQEEWWFMLTFLPRPVSQWRVLPANNEPQQQEIYSVIDSAIGGRR